MKALYHLTCYCPSPTCHGLVLQRTEDFRELFCPHCGLRCHAPEVELGECLKDPPKKPWTTPEITDKELVDRGELNRERETVILLHTQLDDAIRDGARLRDELDDCRRTHRDTALEREAFRAEANGMKELCAQLKEHLAVAEFTLSDSGFTLIARNCEGRRIWKPPVNPYALRLHHLEATIVEVINRLQKHTDILP